MKEVQMTFRVESELRTRFTAAAELDHRPAAQVLRELMRAYVGQARTVPVAIAADAQQARANAVRFARASVGLEGFEPSAEAQAHAQRFINGEIDLQAYLAPRFQDVHGQ